MLLLVGSLPSVRRALEFLLLFSSSFLCAALSVQIFITVAY